MCGNDVMYPTPHTILIDDWIQFQYPYAELNNLRKRMEYLIKTVMIVPNYKYTDLDYKIVKALRAVLDIEEKVISSSYPDNLGDKPKFLLPLKEYKDVKASNNSHRNNQNWRATNPHNNSRSEHNRGNWREVGTRQNLNNSDSRQRTPNYNPKQSTNNYRNFNKSVNVSKMEKTFGASHEIGNQYETSTEHSNRLISQNISSSSSDCYSVGVLQNTHCSKDVDNNPLDSATKLLNGLTVSGNKMGGPTSATKRFSDYPDENIYLLIKPKSISNVKIAYGSRKWVFAPQTEKKVLFYHRVRFFSNKLNKEYNSTFQKL